MEKIISYLACDYQILRIFQFSIFLLKPSYTDYNSAIEAKTGHFSRNGHFNGQIIRQTRNTTVLEENELVFLLNGFEGTNALKGKKMGLTVFFR